MGDYAHTGVGEPLALWVSASFSIDQGEPTCQGYVTVRRYALVRGGADALAGIGYDDERTLTDMWLPQERHR